MLARDSSRVSGIGIVLVTLLLIVSLASVFAISGSSGSLTANIKSDSVATIGTSSNSDLSRESGGSQTVSQFSNDSSAFNYYGRFGVLDNNFKPLISSVSIVPFPSANDADDLNVSATASDADNESFTLHFNWYINGTSWSNLFLPMDYDVQDHSGFGNDGSIVFAFFNGTGGAVGGGFNFDGVMNNLTVPDSNTLDVEDGTNFTLCAWVRTEDTDGAIVSKYTSGNNGYQLGVSSSNAYFRVGDGVQTAAVTGSTTITDESLYHICGIFEEAYNVRLFVNGTEEGTPQVSSSIDSMVNTQIFTIGWGESLGFLSGMIDEVVLYNRSLTPAQIELFYNNGTPLYNASGNETGRDDEWNVSVVAIDARGLNSTVNFSANVSMQNQAPGAFDIDTPNDGNNTNLNRTVFFNWTQAVDPDGDEITYTLYVSLSTCGVPLSCTITSFSASTTSTNYTPNVTFDVDSLYNWTVNASDGTTITEATSGFFNFTVPSAVGIELIRNSTSFGTLQLTDTENTSDDSPLPMMVENTGNVFANVSIYAQSALWDSGSAPLDTSFYQFQAGVNDSEQDAFVTAESNMSWTNMDGTSGLEAKHVIGKLNYTDRNDTAEIDIQVTVPFDEPAGSKTSTIVLTGAIAEP